MRFTAAVSLLFLSLFAATQSTPVIRNASSDRPQLAERQLLNLDLGTTTLATSVLVGDPTCPAVEGDVNARAFAVVNIGETLTLAGNLGLGGLSLTRVRATVVTDVLVCLCVRVGANIGAGDLAGLNAAAIADIRARVSAGTLLNLLNLVGVDLNLDLAPNSQTTCTCSGLNQYTTCTNGQCGCATCPAGQIYNPTTGSCTLAPSPGARRRAILNAGRGHNEARGLATSHRQAKKADVVERFQIKQLKAVKA